MNFYPIYAIVGNEFRRLAKDPMVAMTVGILSLLAIVNALGVSSLLPALENRGLKNALINVGFGNILFETSLIISFLALSTGVLSIAHERSNKSLNVLFTKPLYRRDIIIGKIAGINLFLITVITITLTLFTLFMILAYSSSFSITEFIFRLGTFYLLLIINSAVTIGISMLIGTLIKNYFGSLIVGLSFMYLSWFSEMPAMAGMLTMVNPVNLYLRIFSFNGVLLFNTSVSYSTWFSNALPLIVVLMAEAVIFSLVATIVFLREET